MEDGQFVAAAGLKDNRCLDTGDPGSIRELVEGEVLQCCVSLTTAADELAHHGREARNQMQRAGLGADGETGEPYGLVVPDIP